MSASCLAVHCQTRCKPVNAFLRLAFPAVSSHPIENFLPVSRRFRKGLRSWEIFICWSFHFVWEFVWRIFDWIIFWGFAFGTCVVLWIGHDNDYNTQGSWRIHESDRYSSTGKQITMFACVIYWFSTLSLGE